MKLGLRARILCALSAALLLVLLAIGATVLLAVPAHERIDMLWRIGIAGTVAAALVLVALSLVLRREVAVVNDGFNGMAQALAQRERELQAVRAAVSDEGGRAKSQFLALMSHELRTPLNAVLGLAELLHGTRLDTRQQRFVALIRQSARVLAGVIDDVLDAKRLDAGAFELVEAPFRLREAVSAVVERYRAGADRRGLSLQLQFDSALPDVVRGDLVHVGQILGNLLSNAIKFTEHGGVIVRVTPSELGVRCSVTDTGVGIASDVMPHIYDAFRQGDGSNTRRFGGTGLGLAIARQLCAAMGGRIDASSRPGKGSTFWFDLPLPAAPGGIADAAGTSASGMAEAAATSAAPHNGPPLTDALGTGGR